MKALTELTTDQLGNVKNLLGTKIFELDRDINRNHRNLTNRVTRQEVNTLQATELQTAVDRATNVRDALVAGGASADAIADAEDILSTAQSAKQGFDGGNNLTDEEAQLLSLAIQDLEGAKARAVAKLAEVDTLLAA